MTLNQFWICFVPLFIAVDAMGVLPMFISLTEGIDDKQRKNVILSSVITAAVVGFLFLFVGQAILHLLGITLEDFMIAGGIILFLISVGDLITVEKPLRRVQAESLGPVPIGVPLIVGPAVLTTIMLLGREHGLLPTALAMVSNIAIAGIMFYLSGAILKLIGNSGSKILSKIANLFLAAIAVMLVRRGLVNFIGG
ncbi:MAG TPA: MarC family protein [Chitinispirillaceae bacterium]|nr:MarC family protein [Chitinispirillaceae bacterium]